MKLTYALMITAAIAVTSGTDAVAQSARLSDVGAVHNFTDDLYNNVPGGPSNGILESQWNMTGEICQPCHTPHGNGGPTGTMITGLLWSHTLGTDPFTYYSSDTLDSPIGTEYISKDKMCQSCHDGSVGVDAFAHNDWQNTGGAPVLLTSGTPGSNVWGYQTYPKTPGAGLHPISVDYDADPAMNDKNATAMGISGFIVDVLEGGNMMGCFSCHDVHEDQVPDGVPHLLRVDNDLSGLCLTCHDK